jgi:hypothetical protein
MIFPYARMIKEWGHFEPLEMNCTRSKGELQTLIIDNSGPGQWHIVHAEQRSDKTLGVFR